MQSSTTLGAEQEHQQSHCFLHRQDMLAGQQSPAAQHKGGVEGVLQGIVDSIAGVQDARQLRHVIHRDHRHWVRSALQGNSTLLCAPSSQVQWWEIVSMPAQ